MKAAAIFGKITTAMTAVVFLLAASVTAPALFGIVPFVVLSGSMEPAVRTGAIAYINTNDKGCEEGDIITFRLGDGNLVTHRIIRNEGGSLVTKGDANESVDAAAVKAEQVVGTYMFQVPQAGYLLHKMGKKQMLAVIFWVLFLNGASAMISSAAGKQPDPEDEGPEK